MSQQEQPPIIRSTTALLIAGVIVVALRLLIAGSLRVLDEVSPSWLIRVLSFVEGAIAALATGIAALYIVQQRSSATTPTVSQFRQWLRLSAAACVIAVVIPDLPQSSWRGVVGGVLGSVIAVVIVAWIAYMLIRVCYGYRTVRTELLLRGVGLVLGSTLLLRWIEPLASAGTFDAPYVFSTIVIGVLVLLLARRRRWLTSLPRLERWSIGIWGSIAAVFAIIAASDAYDRSSSLARLLDLWLVGSSLVAAHVFVMLAVYSLVVVWTVLTSGSSAERKRFEFDAITFFNSVAAEHSEPQKLYDTITALAIALTDATSAGLFLRQESGTWNAVSWSGVDPERARSLELEEKLSQIPLHQPILIPHLQDDERFFRIARSVESFAQAAVLMPLWEDSVCNGVIVSLSDKPYSFEQSDVESLASFAPAVSIVLANQRLLRTAIEQERLQRELMLGRQIQQRLLPTAIPPLNGWEVVGWYESAYEVGGDYFDYFYLGNGRACIIVADVSGKGISAAFYMAKLKGICIALAPFCSTVYEFVVGIQRALDGVLEPRVYVTLFAVGIDPTGGITMIRAGHPPALYSTHDGRTCVLAPPGIALGLVSTSRFADLIEEIEVDYRTIKHLIVYTDGLIEAGIDAGCELGIDGLRDIVESSSAAGSAQAMVHAIRQGIIERIGTTSFNDDITVVVMRRITTNG